jgi:hypothetical protein
MAAVVLVNVLELFEGVLIQMRVLQTLLSDQQLRKT